MNVDSLLESGAPPPDLAALLAIQDAAELLVAQSRVDASASIAGQPSTAARGWFEACLLEKLGRGAEARERLASLPEPAWGDARALWLLTRARLELAGGASPRFLLRLATRAASSYRLLRQLDTAWRQWIKRAGPDHGLKPVRLAFAGTVTADFLFPALRAELFADGLLPEIWSAPFGQYRQAILAGDAKLRAFAPDLVVLAPDWRSAARAASAEAQVEELAALWPLCRERFGASGVVQWNFEVPPLDPLGRLGKVQSGARSHLLQAVNAGLWDAERAGRGALILDIDGIASEFGKSQWDDPAAWEISRQYPSTAATPLLARHHAALIRAIRGLSSKCLVLDLDNTLWGGVIGDDGLEGIQLGGTGGGAAFRLFQEYIGELHRRGVLLAVCSKNDEENALAPFRSHPEMVLKESDIAVFRANWEPKEVNLQAIAAAINIGADALVFVDDNPAERARIRQTMPEVEVIELPPNPLLYRQALGDALRFEAVAVTGEDLLRGQSIRANARRQEMAAAAANPEAYLHGLGMRVAVERFHALNLARIVQLINKTNQFNLTGVRTTEAEVRAWMSLPNFYSLTVRLEDRFGEFGLTGILFGFLEGDTVVLSNWLMSCRILGRGIEECMLASLAAGARALGAVAVEAEYLPTAKNGMVADLCPRLGFQAIGQAPNGGSRFRLDLAATPCPMPAWLAVDTRL